MKQQSFNFIKIKFDEILLIQNNVGHIEIGKVSELRKSKSVPKFEINQMCFDLTQSPHLWCLNGPEYFDSN